MSGSSSWWSCELPYRMDQLVPSMEMLALLRTKGPRHPFSTLSLLSHEAHGELLRATLSPGCSWCHSSVFLPHCQGFVWATKKHLESCMCCCSCQPAKEQAKVPVLQVCSSPACSTS